MDRFRRISRLAHVLALLAILARILVPAFHSHSCTHCAHAKVASASATETCSCGAHHHSDSGDATDEQAAPLDAPGHHHCLACELESGTPCGTPGDASEALHPALSEGRMGLRPGYRADTFRVALPDSRAPPAATDEA